MHVAPIEQVAEERWVRGAVVLVGDAAHGMSPNMAEGAALAFEDALVLAACLRDGGYVTEALAAFVARRHRRTGWVRTQTHRRDRTRDLPPVLRDLTLRAFGRQIFGSNYRPLRKTQSRRSEEAARRSRGQARASVGVVSEPPLRGTSGD